MGGKQKTVKKKGPKGKKARAKAKLDRQWGERTIHDDGNQTRRKPKNRISSRHDGKKSSEVNNSFENEAANNSFDQNSKRAEYDSSGSNRRIEHLNFMDSDNDSDTETNPLNTLLKSIGKGSKKKVAANAYKNNGNIMDEDDDEIMEVEESESESEDDAFHLDTVVLEEDENEDGNTSSIDLFKQRFSRDLLKKKELEASVLKTKKVVLNRSLEFHVSTFVDENHVADLLPESNGSKKKTSAEWKDLAETSFAANRVALRKRWKGTDKEVMNDYQAPIYSFLTRYSDLLLTPESPKRRREVQKIFSLHILNHILTARGRIQRHNRQLKEMENNETNNDNESTNDVDENQFRDQGYTRPTVLVLLPTRAICYRFVKDLLKGAGTELESEHSERFEAEYGDIPNEESEDLSDEQERRRQSILQMKGKEWNSLFGDNVNQDDDFKLGISFNPKVAKGKKAKKENDSSISMKLYTDFYRSDVIVASPLGLKMLIAPDEDGAEGDSDYLSSIEICLVDRADVLMMQNWDHVNDILALVNQPPQKNNDTDFSRVRNYLLEGQGAHWRQLLISSTIVDPCMLSTFKRFGKSFSGSVKMRQKTAPEDATTADVLVPIRQVFQKIMVENFSKQSEARVNFFVKNILPEIQRRKQKYTMIYIPSYFDFVAVRNIFLRRELSFVSVTEYSRTSEVSRGRARFQQGRKPIMLYTGRCNFYQRHSIKGIRHLIFLGLPEHPNFYADQVNSINTNSDVIDADGEASSASCLALFTRYEAHALERIVGSSNCTRMISGEKSTFMFQS